jgi:uncharacterized membrane protein
VKKLAILLFAGGLSGLGVLSLIYDDFAMVWQPVPTGVPLRVILAYASGIVLLVGGICTLPRRTAPSATFVLTAFLFSWLLLLQVPRVASDPLNEGMWLGLGETLVLVSGGWVLAVTRAMDEGRKWGDLASGAPGVRLGRFSFGLALPLIGLSHFVYAVETASMVPAWIPLRLGFAYLTGAGHIAAGLGLLLGILPRLAATLEALMISSFVLLLHVPGVVAEPSSRLQWTMVFVASTLAGSAWSIAASAQGAPWGRGPRSRPASA